MKLDRQIFHSQDLAVVWHITNKNTLYTTIKRYVQKGIFVPIYKGLYSTVPIAQLNPLELGRAIVHNYAYLSTESVLAQAGAITQATFPYTFVGPISKKITLGDKQFLFRKLKDEYLYNPIGVTNQNGIFTASPERAMADMLNFNPKYYFDVPGIIDLKLVKQIQKQVGYTL